MDRRIRKRAFAEIIYAGLVFMLCFSNRYLGNQYKYIFTLLAYFRIFLLAGVIGITLFFRIKSSRTVKLTLMMAGVIFVSTVIHGGPVSAAVNLFTPVLLVIMTLDLVKKKKYIVRNFFDTWMWLMCFLAVIDLASIFLYPGGMYRTDFYTNNWFLGYKTERMIYTLPMVMIAFFKAGERKTSAVTAYCLALLAVYGAYLSGATAGFVVLLLFIVFATLVIMTGSSDKDTIANKILNFVSDYKFVISLYIIVTLIVVIVQRSEIITLISVYFGKKEGLSSRTGIWQACISEILRSPVIGYGYLDSNYYLAVTRNIYGTNAHNMFLTVVMNGGLISLGLYFMLIVSAFRTESERRERNIILRAEVYVMLLLGITSSILVFSQYAMLAYWMIENAGGSDRSVLTNGRNKTVKNRKKYYIKKPSYY